MKSPRKSHNWLQVYPTQEEKEEISNLFNELDISKQRQSELFIGFIIDGLKKLSSSKDAYTQTNQQLNEKEIKIDALNKIRGFIHSSPKKFSQVFNFFFKTFAEQFGSYRTRLAWMKHLFESDEFVILNLKSYLGDYYVIEKHSYFHAQFKENCFAFPHERLNYQPTAEKPARDKIYNLLNIKYQHAKTLDKAEEFALKAFVAHINHDEKPMINDLVIRDVLDLRANWKHQDAIDLLKQEKEFKQAQKLEADSGMQFLEALGK